MLEPVSNKMSFPEMERGVLAFWEAQKTFEKSLAQRKGREEYVFYDGPPFATGMPHYGHLLAGIIKDIVPRYQTMRGHYVERRFGWDCHGLPIEALAQEKLGLKGPADIRAAGIDVFNETCRSMVLRYVEEWRKTVTRMGRWVDFDNDYKTMDLTYMETIWWVFKQLWDQGRIYKSYRIMPYSWKLTTPLSNFEAGSNYQDVQDPAITVRLRLTSGKPSLTAGGSTETPPSGQPSLTAGCPAENWYALIWTTTPWTLPGNLAICAGPDIDYVAVRDREDGSVYVLAQARLGAYYKKEEAYEVVKTFKGRDLKGWTFEPIFPYFADRKNAFRILNDAFVSTEDGTGIVHLAPAYGEDDFSVCRAEGIELADPLDESCNFTEPVTEYAGMFCKDADKLIIRRLKDEKKLVHQSTIVHSYPFCDRTDTPLIYRAIDAWYVKVEDLREQLVANNETIHWVPGYVGSKRFGNWLQDAKDWNISRNRFWGSCLPIWIAEDGSDMICVGSIAELEKLSGKKVDDLHKHTVDQITFVKNGKTYRRTPEVLDCWFESGAMPYAQQHYPFEHKEDLNKFFPAHFIAEGLDQTRGWFYTLLILSTAIFKKSCFRNVVVNGLILAEDGRKMSKRLKNYPDPVHILETYGADALRLYMIHSPVVRAEDLRFSEDGVKDALRHLLIPLWNAYSFFVTYARVDGWTPAAGNGKALAGDAHLLDRWILSSLDHLISDVTGAMDVYDLQQAVRPFVAFIEDLTNWYIRRSRRRFWKSTDDDDKAMAYRTLYTVLLQLSKVAAPFVPFISENIYRNLRTADMPESVHLCDFPQSSGANRDEALEKQMAAVMSVVVLGRQLRSAHDLKVRQPLPAIHVISRDAALLEQIVELKDIIADELNVKNIWFSGHEAELVTLKAKPNFKNLGPRLGPAVKQAAAAIQKIPQRELERVIEGKGTVSVEIAGQNLDLGLADLVIERVPHPDMVVASEKELVVALETGLTEELVREGLAREFVNRVQNMRRTMDMNVTQRISIRFFGDEELREALDEHGEYIRNETLARQVAHGGEIEAGEEPIDLNGHACNIKIEIVKSSS